MTHLLRFELAGAICRVAVRRDRKEAINPGDDTRLDPLALPSGETMDGSIGPRPPNVRRPPGIAASPVRMARSSETPRTRRRRTGQVPRRQAAWHRHGLHPSLQRLYHECERKLMLFKYPKGKTCSTI
jgi:hypothetical protein